jgi:hypothetical protein
MKVLIHRDDVAILKRTATPISLTLIGPLLEAAIGLVQTHMASIIDGACLWLFHNDSGGADDRKEVFYTADDPVEGYPRTGGAHQPDGLETGPFHRLVMLARDLVYPDGTWNVETSPRRDETVRPAAKEGLMREYQNGLAG